MSKEVLAAILALAAAMAAAIGNVVRQRSAQEVTDKEVGHLTLMGMLLRDKRWWMGGIGDISSYCFLAWALDEGSVLLVMSLQVTQLLFALPFYSRWTRHPINRLEWVWALVLMASLAVVIAVGQPQGDRQTAPASTWLIVSLAMGPLLVLGVLGARVWRDRPVAAVLLAAVAGSLLAAFAVLIKGVVWIVKHDLQHLFTRPEIYLFAFSGVAGMIFHQSAYRAGSLTASLPTIIVAKPVVGAVLGIAVLSEDLNCDGVEWAVLALAALAVIVATVGLARGEAATVSAGAGRDLKLTGHSTDQAPEAPSEHLNT